MGKKNKKNKNNENVNNNDDMEIPPKNLWKTMDNPFVEDYRNGKIIYSKDFYAAMYKRISEQHMTYVEAYQDMGFDIKVLGTDRANACGKRAMDMAEKGKLNLVDPSTYDGSVPPEKMGKMTHEEEFAYLKARNAYLEEAWRLKKKFLSELTEKPISLTKEPK